MKNFDNNMEMFDAYLNGEMSLNDRKELEAKLDSDNALKQEFKDYKVLLCALQASCSDADKEFEEALRNIDDEAMNSIVASKKAQGTPTPAVEKPKGKVVPLKTVYRWMSASAVVLLIVGVGTHFVLTRQARNNMCDALVACHEFSELTKSRGENQQLDDYNMAINLLNSDKTDEAIKILEDLYKTKNQGGGISSTKVGGTIGKKPGGDVARGTLPQVDDVRVNENCPVALAYAYVKNHDIDNAKRIIDEVKKELGDNTPAELLKLEKALEKK